MMEDKKLDLKDGLIIFAMAAIFCLKFYHSRFVVQGDVYLNLYMHGNSSLFWKGWDPYVWGYLGWYPVFGGMFPLNLIMHTILNIFFGNSPYATLTMLQVNAVISLFLLGFFTYMLFRFLGRSRAGAIIGSIILSFTGFHAHTSIREFDLFYLHSFMFVPLALIFLTKANQARSVKWAFLGGLTIGISLLGGGNVPMFLFIPAFLLTYIIGRPLVALFSYRMILRSVAYFILALAIGMAIGLVVILPGIEYMKYSSRNITYHDIIISCVSPLYTFITMLYRDWWPQFKVHTLTVHYYHEYDSFLGIPVIFLALLGVLRPNREIKAKWFMLFLALFAFLLMHLSYLPRVISETFSYILSKQSIRYPFRYFMVFLFSTSFFAACGFDYLKNIFTHRMVRPLFFILGAITIAYSAVGIRFLKEYTPYELCPSLLEVLIITALFFLVLLVIFCLYKLKGFYSVKLTGALIGGIIFLLYYAAPSDIRLQMLCASRGDKPEALQASPQIKSAMKDIFDTPKKVYDEFLKKSPFEFFRIYNRTNIMRQNIWAGYAKADIAFEPWEDPASPFFLANYARCLSGEDSPLFDLYNVVYLRLENYRGQKLAPTPIKGLYYNPYAFKRFFITHNAVNFKNENMMWMSLRRASRDELKDNVFLISSHKAAADTAIYPPLEPEGEGVEVVEKKPDSVIVNVRLDRSGYLVASELWFPAWSVSIDAKPAELLRAYGTFWAVALDKGSHRVSFSFNDKYTRLAIRFSLACILVVSFLAALLFLRDRNRRTD